MNLGTPELIIIAVLVIVVFGAGWLPKAARNMGRAKVELERTQKQITEAKDQMVEATGLGQAEEAVRKANKALNQSPKNLLKGAATGALRPPSEPTPRADGASDDSTEAGSEPAGVVDADKAETVNVDYSEGEIAEDL